MLVLPPLVSDGGEGEWESFMSVFDGGDIGFEDVFIGVGEGDVLPDLEMDLDMFAEFSLSGGEEAGFATFLLNDKGDGEENRGSDFCSSISSSKEECELLRINSSSRKGYKGRKSSKTSKGKHKMKIDWTPELHRKFVEAVEQLGMDNAVPSKILELMGIGCLTRHHIASHLQKYRSHQKHLKAREVEAASWNQRRQYGGVRGETAPWMAPTIAFPPPPLHIPILPFPRPLHVWGLPAVENALWPKSVAQRATLPPWTPPPATTLPHVQPYTTFLHRQHASTRFPAPTVSDMYRVDHGIDCLTGQWRSHLPTDFNPSKDIIDEVIGEVLSKPTLPLPLGLKPPSVDSVMSEQQRQRVPKIPHALFD